jgi:hypothetical protein
MTRKRTSDEYYTKEWMLDLPAVKNWILSRINGPFMDTNAGEGAWLVKILETKLANGMAHETALQQLYGVELQEDSAKICRDRLLMGNESLRPIVEQNIVCADALRYHYRFDGSHPYDDEVAKQKKEELFNSFFALE